jgi:hypothetical protein
MPAFDREIRADGQGCAMLPRTAWGERTCGVRLRVHLHFKLTLALVHSRFSLPAVMRIFSTTGSRYGEGAPPRSKR